jgi:hypothetical protein
MPGAIVLHFPVAINIPYRAVVILAGLLLVSTVLAADLGTKVVFKQNSVVPFATFTITFLGERRVTTDKYPRGFLLYDFRVASADGSQVISWSAGTGDIGPTLFRVGSEGFALELVRSDKLGRLEKNEMVVSRAP